MIALIHKHVLAGSKKNDTAPYIFIVMLVYAIVIIGQAIAFYEMDTILIRAGACVGILASFVVLERSSLSVTTVSFLSPLLIIIFIAIATFDGDGGALLIFLHIIAATMVSFSYMQPKGVALFVATVSIVSFSILAVLNINILGEPFSMVYNYLYLAITLALNVLLCFFCKSHKDTITELIETRNEANKASKSKSIFLSNMSHEIRTPITVVLGVSEIELQRGNIPSETKDSLGRIHDSASLLLRLINDILDFSGLEDNRMPIRHQEYEMTDLISAVAHPHYIHLKGKDIKFSLKLGKSLPVSLIGDSIRIEQIMMNLLSNSFKYTEKGTVDLHIQCQPHDDEHVMLVLSVSDTGVGMTKKQLATIFSEYSRFHENLKSNVNGTGLGMAIVQKLITLMDGKINITSEIGKCTNVTVCIPQKVSRSETLSPETTLKLQQFESTSHSDSRKLELEPMPYGNVLVVDDVDANLHVINGLLDLYGITTETCTRGQIAIDKIKSGKSYDIVFMDYMMPEMNGIEAMQELRKMGYTKPIVLITANVVSKLDEEYSKNGFDGFLSKPIITSELNKVLVEFIRDKQPPEVIQTAKKSNSISQEDLDKFQNSDKLINKIRADFVKKRRNIVTEIEQAISAQDMDTAHRLAHTLKGLAATIKEPELVSAALYVEEIFETGKMPENNDMLALKQEMAKVLEKLEGMGFVQAKSDEGGVEQLQKMSVSETVELLNKVKPLLELQKAQCLEYKKELFSIPEAVIIARQIEKLDFLSALKSLNTLLDVLK